MTTTRDLVQQHREDIRLMKRSLIGITGEINWRQVVMDLDTLEEQCVEIERSIPQTVLVDTSRFVPAPLPAPLPDVPLAGPAPAADGSNVTRGGAPMGVSQSGGGYDQIESRVNAAPDPALMGVSGSGQAYDGIQVRSQGPSGGNPQAYAAPARQGMGQNEMIVTSRNPQGPALAPGANPSLGPVPVNDMMGGTYEVRTRPAPDPNEHGSVSVRPPPDPNAHGAVAIRPAPNPYEYGAVAPRSAPDPNAHGAVVARPPLPAPVPRLLPDGSTVMEVADGVGSPMTVVSRPSVGPVRIDPRYAHVGVPIGSAPAPASAPAAPVVPDLPPIAAVEAASAAEALRRVTEGLSEVPSGER